MIDAHAHCCGVYLNEQTIIEHLDKNRFEKVILCAGEPEGSFDYHHPMLSDIFKDENTGFNFNGFIEAASKLKHLPNLIEGENLKIASLARLFPERILAAYCVDPTDPKWQQKAETDFKRHKYCMIKLHQCWHDFNIASNQFDKLVLWSQNRNLPIFIHLKNSEQALYFTASANKHCNAVFIVAHCLGFDIIDNALKSSNVYFDLSSPQLYSADTLRKAYIKYGAERLIFASDAPYGRNNPQIIFDRLEKLWLSQEEFDFITHQNICRILNI